MATRYGLGVLLTGLGLDKASDGSTSADKPLPLRTRMALEELGPTLRGAHRNSRGR